MGLVNWRELEKLNDWATHMTEEDALFWDKGAQGWDRRTIFEREFTARQAAAMDRITKEDTVLDACCGVGRLSIPLAKMAKSVTALDYGVNMLALCEKNAREAGLDNIHTMQCNWHTSMPGVDFPKHDIAVACISPAHADILKFSKAANKYCYFLSFSKKIAFRHVLWELFEGCNEFPLPGKRSEVKIPDLGLGLNVHFNILYDLGAHPTVDYVDGGWKYEADTEEDVLAFLATLGKIGSGKEQLFADNARKRMTKLENGRYQYHYDAQMYVLGWDPNEILQEA